MDNKHPRREDSPVTLTDDLERNPGIGQSKGVFARQGRGAEALDGDNTIEGDVENDAGLGQGVDPDRLGRTNR